LEILDQLREQETKGVHNVLWVMGYGHDGAMSDYWPGKAYADLGGIDEYDKGTQPFTNLFNGTKAVVGSTSRSRSMKPGRSRSRQRCSLRPRPVWSKPNAEA
jgi:Glycosyl hydrolase family 26